MSDVLCMTYSNTVQYMYESSMVEREWVRNGVTARCAQEGD
jgi:hypothetical protein